jgi:hypothetical protein
MKCPKCKYYSVHINKDGQSSVEAAKNGVLRESRFCLNPEVVRTKGDGVNPVPLDTEEVRIANERYRSIPRASKWNRSPNDFTMTTNTEMDNRTFKVVDDEKEVSQVIWDNAIPIQKAMEEMGIVDFAKATPEEREIILGLREKGEDDKRGYTAQKINIHQWIDNQMWDHGCTLGARRIDSNDSTDVGLKVKVKII